MVFTIKAAGQEVDLSGKTVTMTVRKDLKTDPIIDDAACTPDADQSTNKGKCSYLWAEPATSKSAGTYLVEFKVTDGVEINFFPTDENGNRTYGKLIIQESL